MNTFIFAICASVLLVSGCASFPQDKIGAPMSVAALPTPATHIYRCNSGETISARYPSADSAVVQYQGSHYDMNIAVSGSGSRYTGGGLEWWTNGSGRGSGGSLFQHRTDGTSGSSIELCDAF